jgi:hypothetical protein
MIASSKEIASLLYISLRWASRSHHDGDHVPPYGRTAQPYPTQRNQFPRPRIPNSRTRVYRGNTIAIVSSAYHACDAPIRRHLELMHYPDSVGRNRTGILIG